MRWAPSATTCGVAILLVAHAASADPPREPGAETQITVRGEPTTAFATRVRPEDAPREPLDAAALLEAVPSVHVRRLGADGSFGAMSVRGAASTGVGVLFAGIPLTSAADPSADVGALPVWPGATFRVWRGFAPAALGATGYLGGVVAIEPPGILEPDRTEAWWAAGSFGSLKLRLADRHRAGKTQVATALFASRSDGDFSFEAAPPGSVRTTTRERANAGYASTAAAARVAHTGERGGVGATIFAEKRRGGIPGTADAPTEHVSLGTARIVAGVDGRLRTGEAGALHTALWARHERASVDDPRGELPLRTPGGTANAVESVGGSLGWRGHPTEPFVLDAFVDARGERFVPDGPAAAASANRVAAGVGVDGELHVTKRLSLSASGRLDLRRDAADLDGRDRIASDATPNGSLGVAYRVVPALTVSAHGGALARPPSFLELYGDRGALVGDVDLQPERAVSADAGALWHVAVGRQLELGGELVGFVSRVHDLITFVQLGRGTLRAANVDEALIGGAELALDLKGRHVATRVSYTLLVTRNESDDPLVHGAPLPGRPLHDLAYDASYTVGPAKARYGLDAIAGTTLDAGDQLPRLPPRVLHSVGASLAVPGVRGLVVGVEVDNLLDDRTVWIDSRLSARSLPIPVSDFLGFPLPGRSVWGTASLTLE